MESINLNSNQKRFIKDVVNPVLSKLIDNTADKYNRTLKHFKTVLIDILDYYSKIYAYEKWNKLGGHFASTRNTIAHGELKPFSKESTLAYEIGNVLIDCIILQKSGFTHKEIKEIINKKYL